MGAWGGSDSPGQGHRGGEASGRPKGLWCQVTGKICR